MFVTFVICSRVFVCNVRLFVCVFGMVGTFGMCVRLVVWNVCLFGWDVCNGWNVCVFVVWHVCLSVRLECL